MRAVKSLVVFEDAPVRALDMVAALRAAFDLRCGGRTLFDRHSAESGAAAFTIVVRPAVQDLAREAHPNATLAMPRDATVFLNARLLLCGADFARLAARANVAVWSGEALVALHTPGAAAAALAAELVRRLDAPAPAEPLRRWVTHHLPQLESVSLADEPGLCRDGSCLLDHVWDFVHHNGEAICDDFRKGSP